MMSGLYCITCRCVTPVPYSSSGGSFVDGFDGKKRAVPGSGTQVMFQDGSGEKLAASFVVRRAVRSVHSLSVNSRVHTGSHAYAPPPPPLLQLTSLRCNPSTPMQSVRSVLLARTVTLAIGQEYAHVVLYQNAVGKWRITSYLNGKPVGVNATATGAQLSLLAKPSNGTRLLGSVLTSPYLEVKVFDRSDPDRCELGHWLNLYVSVTKPPPGKVTGLMGASYKPTSKQSKVTPAASTSTTAALPAASLDL